MKRLTRATLRKNIEDACLLDEAAAEGTLAAVLRGLAGALAQPGTRHLAALIGERSLPGDAGVIGHTDELVAFVAREAGRTPAAALEAIVVVTSAIAAAWSEDDERVFTRALEPSLRALFVERPAADVVPREDAGATLATGAPGSRRPLSRSAPVRER